MKDKQFNLKIECVTIDSQISEMASDVRTYFITLSWDLKGANWSANYAMSRQKPSVMLGSGVKSPFSKALDS